MKLKLLAFCTLSLFTITATQEQLPFKIGIKIGANLNKLDGHSFKDGFKVGYLVGGFVDLKVAKSISLQPELLFSQTTSTVSSSILNAAQANKLNLHYMSIPIIVNYKLLPMLKLQVGPQFGVLLNSNESILQSGARSFKSGDFSAVVGAQVNILKFNAGLRYVIGLTDINDLASQEKWKNQSIQLSVGYNIL